ncbi:MAG TPA: LCP family protein [Tissierellaceae bacterium]|nr:LCP family protein [Tissierellaceae bacterium]
MKKKFIITFILSLVVFSLVYSTLWYKILDKETVAAPNDNSEDIDNAFDEDYELPVDNEILFLMMGVDAKDVKQSKGTRTDTLMLFKVNFDSGKIDILSLPRDTRVLVRGKEDKINHAHAYGGPSLTIRTVEDFLGIDLNYYVKIDYNIVESIVDAIDGIEIDVPQRMSYRDPTDKPPLNINLQPGLQTLYGDDAHDFLRFRSYPDGDLGRIKAQQYFMKELIKQTLQLKNIVKLPGLVETYFDNVETNIPMGLVLKGVGAAKNIDSENMTTNTITGTSRRINGLDYLIYDREETEAIVQEMFEDYLLKQ